MKNQTKLARTPYVLRLATGERAELSEAAARAGVPPAALARQLLLSGLRQARREENLAQHVAAEVTAEIKPALTELSKIAAGALAASEFVDMYGPGYLTLCEIAKRLEVPVHKISPKNKNPEHEQS